MFFTLFADSTSSFAGPDFQQLAAALRKIDVEAILLPVLMQLAVIICVGRLFGLLAKRIGQPSVVGEILAGLILGPSVLGRVWPDALQWLFHPAIGHVDPALQPLGDVLLHWIFTTLSQIGLVLLLFLIGLEFDFSHLRQGGKTAGAISLAGVALPFALGALIAPFILPYLGKHPLSNDPIPLLSFTLFMGTSMSITALPVLGRIMMELGITGTRIGAITISAAAVDDALGWILLAGVAMVVRGEFSPQAIGLMFGAALTYSLLLLFVGGPLLRAWARRAMQIGRGELPPTTFAVLLAIVFASAIATNRIGIFAIFGAFLVGAVLSPEREFRQAVSRKLHDFVTVFFLPIFFTYTGLRTRIDTLADPTLWAIGGLVIAVAILGKFGGCGIAARAFGMNAQESLLVGSMMNTRGLMELIVINVGYELQVVPPSLYCMLVLMAVVTTFMTTPLILRFMPGTEIESSVRSSDFAKKAAILSS